MSHPHKRKRIVIRLTPEQQSDPQSILAATRGALRDQADLTLVVQTAPPEDRPDPSAEPRMPLEQLETAAHELAAEVLRKKKEEVAAGSAKPDEAAKADGSRWWRAVKAAGRGIGWAVKEGFKVAIGEAVKAVSSSKRPT